MQMLWIKTITTIAALSLTAALGFAAEPAKPAAKPAPAKVEAVKSAAPKQVLIDINSASDSELKAIPGMSDAYVAKIVAGRPYSNKTQLVSKKVLPEPVYEKIKHQIIAKRSKKTDKKTVSKASGTPETPKK